jgi:DNA-binding transcriptional ArsR family regulator
MLRNEPILFDAVDHDSYVPRPLVERALLDAVATDRGVLVIGESGTGRTTMLNWLATHLAAEHAVARVDASIIDDALALVEAIRLALAAVVDDDEVADRLRSPVDVGGATTAAVRLQAVTRRLEDAPEAIVFVDNLDEPATIKRVFGGLRELLWRSRHRFVVTCLPQDVPIFLAPPADSFFRRRIELPELSASEIIGFVTASNLSHQEAHARIAAAPRRPRPLVAALTSDSSPPGLALALPRELSDEARRLWRELVLLDRPVGPNDRELLQRIGRSPVTVRRHLNELARAGLVRKIVERTNQPGRPPVRYLPDEELVA